MIVLALLPILQYPSVVYGGKQTKEAELLCRYAESLGVHAGLAGSASTVATLYTDETKARQMLKTFNDEFNVKYKDGFPSMITKELDYPFTAQLSSLPGEEPLGAYDKDSLLYKTYKSLLAHWTDFQHDPLLACRFCFRNWMTPSLKRTQTITVLCTFQDGDRKVDLSFTYDPR